MLSSMFTLNHPKQPGANNVEQIPLSVGKISTEQYHLGSWQRDTRRGADKETVRQRELLSSIVLGKEWRQPQRHLGMISYLSSGIYCVAPKYTQTFCCRVSSVPIELA